MPLQLLKGHSLADREALIESLSHEQCLAVLALIGQALVTNRQWREWAESWLSGADISEASAGQAFINAQWIGWNYRDIALEKVGALVAWTVWWSDKHTVVQARRMLRAVIQEAKAIRAEGAL